MTGVKRPTIDRRLETALEHVQEKWFPPNSALLREVQQKLADGAFDLEEQLLVQTLKQDASLFTYCLSELVRLLKQEGIEPPTCSSPVELLQWGGVNRLRQILLADRKPISIHSVAAANNVQRSRIQESIVSITATEMLSEKGGFDPEVGYSAALLRQLGYTLVAWNYPHIYERAVATLHPGTSLESALTKQLGFSPVSLALSLAHKWHISPEICDTLTPPQPHKVVFNEVRAIADTVRKLCEIGEVLARANAPDIYPTAREDWTKAKQMVEARLGRNGMKLIQERVQQNCAQYLEVAPHLFKPGLMLDPEARMREAGKVPDNPFISDCKPEVQTLLSELYQTIIRNHAIEERVRFVVRALVPTAALNHGCIYTVDPGTIMLVPQLPLGRIQCRVPEPIPCAKHLPARDLISRAFRTGEIVIEDSSTSHGSPMTCLAGVLGYAQRMGVLYVELPKGEFAKDPQQHLVHFKALSHALNDSLELH